ncbi:hypothetical protein INQ73_28625, partial [Klebsiella pneumoniae]|nr:hypothetical protein [Klebsiella pneumoniae]
MAKPQAVPTGLLIISALAAATAKGEGLILHPEWLETMTRFFAERGRPMAESNRKQAE